MDLWHPASRAAAMGPAPRRRRRHYRHQIRCLAYLNLDQSNGGIIRNLGEAGITVQAVAPLSADQQVFLRFDLANPRVRVEGTGRVAWTDPVGQAGIEFLSLSQRCRRGLREWMFTQLLATAQQAAVDSAWVGGTNGEAAELLFSSTSRPAIRLPETTPAWLAGEEKSDRTSRPMHLPWLPFSISAS